MKNKKTFKLMFLLSVGLFTMTVASGCSCTSSMCSDADEANIKKQIEKNNIEEWRSNAKVSNSMVVESDQYKAYAANKVDEIYLTDSIYLESTCGQAGTCTDTELSQIKSQIKAKYNDEWLNALEELSPGEDGYIETRTNDFKNYVNEQVDSLYSSHPKACLVTEDDVDPITGARLEKKTWGDAWKTGLLEGLIVYPISWLLSVLTSSFGGGGAAQLFAIVIAVLVIRGLMLVLNFKGQINTIKMQSIQGEMTKLTNKMRDPNLSQQEKQALSMKMMEIYRKNDIHPFSTLLTQFLTFPIFFAVWAAMNQTVAIRKGSLFGLKFGETINTQIFSGNIAAILLFALMITGQIATMKLSSWLKTRKEMKKNPNYQKPQKGEADKQMNIMMTVMIVMVVMSGFLLPAALVLYWFLGSVFSIAQTLVFSTDYVNNKLNGAANRKKKAKVIR